MILFSFLALLARATIRAGRLAAACAVACCLLACRGEHHDQAKALDHYREGRELLEQDRFEAAARAFAAAAALDSRTAVLVSWRALALARAGQLDRAVELLQAEGPDPGLGPHDHYNLAAWLARLDRPAEAVLHLASALRAEPGLRQLVLDDADFAALASNLAFRELVGAAPLEVALAGEEGAILAGELYDLELELQAMSSEPVSLDWRLPLPDGFSLQRVVDELHEQDGGVQRRLSWRLRAVEAGEGQLGPWTVHVGQQQRPLAGVPWQVLLPAGVQIDPREEIPAPASAWWLPREALGDLRSPDAALLLDRLVVVYEPGDQVTVDASAVLEPPLQLEIRQADQVQWLARAWAGAPGSRRARVQVERGGEPVLDRELRR